VTKHPSYTKIDKFGITGTVEGSIIMEIDGDDIVRSIVDHISHCEISEVRLSFFSLSTSVVIIFVISGIRETGEHNIDRVSSKIFQRLYDTSSTHIFVI
jgi:hypothetical protein